jgi:hypothetical protein
MAGGLAVAAGAAAAGTPAAAEPQMTANRPLAARHRVVLTQWPALEDPENGITTVESLYEWAAAKGYDALEMSVDDIKKKFFPNTAPEQVAATMRRLEARYNMPSVGALYHVPDGISAEMGKRVHDDGSRFDCPRRPGAVKRY